MREHRIPTNGYYAKVLRGEDRSIEDVALEAGITSRVVSAIESGEGSIEDCIRKLAAFYGVEYEDLLAGSTAYSTARPDPPDPVDGTVVLNIEIRGGRREALEITFGLEQAANTHFHINLRDFRTGSLILDVQFDRSDMRELLEAFGDGRFDTFGCRSITLSLFDLLIFCVGYETAVTLMQRLPLSGPFTGWLGPILSLPRTLMLRDIIDRCAIISKGFDSDGGQSQPVDPTPSTKSQAE